LVNNGEPPNDIVRGILTPFVESNERGSKITDAGCKAAETPLQNGRTTDPESKVAQSREITGLRTISYKSGIFLNPSVALGVNFTHGANNYSERRALSCVQNVHPVAASDFWAANPERSNDQAH
jgi:hypothetical protein